MRYDLAAATRATKPRRRRSIALRPITPPATLAGDLYAATYKPVITTLTEAVDRIIAAYRTDSMIRDSFTDDLGAILAGLATELNRVVLTIRPGLRSWATRVERYHRERWRGAVLTATGVDLSTILIGAGVPQSVQAAIDWNVSLVSSVSDEGRGRIGNLVFAAFRARKPAAELATELRGAVAMSRRRALGIAGDQLQKLSASLDRERQTDAGIDSYIWRHSFKEHPRRFHVQREGQVYRWDTPPADGPPGTLPFCGCKGQALLVLD